MRALYTAPGASSGLSAATAKTILAVLAPAQFGVNWLRYEISFDGATSTAVPALIELCSLTGATAGTSTAVTVQQVAGSTITAGFTAGTNYTAEPTVLTAFSAFTLPVYGGTGIVPFTPGQEPNSVVSQGFAIRVTAPAAVNARATAWFERA
ncbi:MAG TPA: hypothetical protein PKA64_13450 [Myxococcota bacterium]|nr:hypothetical protein [Myxococcota bacterium]